MKIIFENRIMSSVLFELNNGEKIWHTDMTPTQKVQADKLLAAQQTGAGDLAVAAAGQPLARPGGKHAAQDHYR
jgi:hypothetical protein